MNLALNRDVPQHRQGFCHRARGGDSDVDIIGLKDGAGQVGPVRFAPTQTPQHRFLVVERLQKGERELGRVKRLLGERRHGLLYLDSVHAACPKITSIVADFAWWRVE
jgi:hypothetical protein